jgi:hypothetical protein
MSRLDVPIGPIGPVIEVRLSIGPEDTADFVASGRSIPPPCSVSGLVDTGAERTAIEQSLLDWMGLPIYGLIEVTSSVLGREVREANSYRAQMAFGSPEASGRTKWCTLYAVGVDIVSPGVKVLIGRDLLATCRFTYDGRKRRFMMSY